MNTNYVTGARALSKRSYTQVGFGNKVDEDALRNDNNIRNLVRVKARMQKLEGQNKKLVEENKNLVEKNKNLVEERGNKAALKSKVEKLKSQISGLKQQRGQCVKDMFDEYDMRKACEANKDQAAETAAKLTYEVGIANDTNDQLRKDIDKMKKKLQAVHKEKEDLADDLHTFQKENGELYTQVEELHNMLHKAGVMPPLFAPDAPPAPAGQPASKRARKNSCCKK